MIDEKIETNWSPDYELPENEVLTQISVCVENSTPEVSYLIPGEPLITREQIDQNPRLEHSLGSASMSFITGFSGGSVSIPMLENLGLSTSDAVIGAAVVGFSLGNYLYSIRWMPK